MPSSSLVSENDDIARIRALAGLGTPMALRVAVTLGLPDRLRHNGTAAQVADELGLAPIPLGLLLDHLATIGIVERTGNGYRTTAVGAVLCRDADNGLTNFLHLDMAGGRAEMAFVELLHSVTTGQAGYAHRFGQDFWADLDEHPHLRASFDKQMTDRFLVQVPQIVAGFGWGRFASVVDVGGGHGTLLAAIMAAHPGLRGHLVDLEPAAAGARRVFAERGLGDRATATAGSFFEPLPGGADAYLLCDIPRLGRRPRPPHPRPLCRGSPAGRADPCDRAGRGTARGHRVRPGHVRDLRGQGTHRRRVPRARGRARAGARCGDRRQRRAFPAGVQFPTPSPDMKALG